MKPFLGSGKTAVVIMTFMMTMRLDDWVLRRLWVFMGHLYGAFE